MSDNYYVLDLPFSKYFADSFKLPSFHGDDVNPFLSTLKDTKGYEFGNPNTHNVWHLSNCTADIPKILSAEFINYLNSKKIVIGAVWFFYFDKGVPPGQIHSDWGGNIAHPKHNFNYAINFSSGTTDNQYMCWYEPKNKELNSDGHPVNATMTVHQTISPIWEPSTVNLIEKFSITTPTLVKTHIPHNGVNLGNGTRWAISLKVKHACSKWEDVVSKFTD